MANTTSIDQVRSSSRVIGDVAGTDGPLMVFFGGIHGNEPSGVIALERVFEQLQNAQIPLCGRVIGLKGNLPGLAAGERFISKDLNRLWTNDFSTRYQNRDGKTDPPEVVEHIQQYELFETIEPLLTLDRPIYFLDLHTTSSKSVPFIGVNNRVSNQEFATQFPVAKVLGLDDYLEGPLMGYLDQFGHVTLAFEAGQHEAPESIDIHVAFIYNALLVSGIIDDSNDLAGIAKERALALQVSQPADLGFFEVIFRKEVFESDDFKMNPGFQNFNPIKEGECLAYDKQGPIVASQTGRMLMPLYQSSGNDGYFIVKKIQP